MIIVLASPEIGVQLPLYYPMHNVIVITSSNVVKDTITKPKVLPSLPYQGIARRALIVAQAKQMILNKDPRVCYNGDFDISNTRRS